MFWSLECLIWSNINDFMNFRKSRLERPVVTCHRTRLAFVHQNKKMKRPNRPFYEKMIENKPNMILNDDSNDTKRIFVRGIVRYLPIILQVFHLPEVHSPFYMAFGVRKPIRRVCTFNQRDNNFDSIGKITKF